MFFLLFYKFSLAHKDQDGRVITQPRNFTTKNVKLGKIDSVYFARPSYVCTGDLYQSKSEVKMKTFDHDKMAKAGHENDFKPTFAAPDKVYKAPYPHMSERVEVRKSHKDLEGHVITGPK